MRVFLLSLALLVSSLAAGGCTAVQYPPNSGCWYDISTNWLIFSNPDPHNQCGMYNPDPATGATTSTTVLAAPRRDEPFPFDPTTTTIEHPPLQTSPVTDPPVEPTGHVEPTTPPTVTISTTTTTTIVIGTLPPTSLVTLPTTTTTTTPAAPLVASLSCLASPLGILFAGTGNPGDHVTIVLSDPSDWFAAQPATPTVVAGDGSWQFTIDAGSPSWFPVTVRLAETSGSTAVVSLGTC